MKKLRNLKVATKLIVGFGVLTLLLAVIIGVGLSRLNDARGNLVTLSEQGMASVQAMGEVQADLLKIRTDVLNIAVTSSDARQKGPGHAGSR